MISSIDSFGILAITLAAFLDVLFVTGIFFNGTLLFGVAVGMFALGDVTGYQIFVLALIGTYFASVTNFTFGRLFGSTAIAVRVTQSTGGKKIESILSARSLILAMLICRFFTFSRPLYGLVVGMYPISLVRFLILELVVACVWVGFWTCVLVFGAQGFFNFTVLT